MSICINYDGLRCRGAKIARIFDLFLHGYKISVADVEMYAERFDDGRVIGHFCLPPKAGTTDCVSYNTPSESCDLPIKAPTPAEFVSWMNQRKPEDADGRDQRPFPYFGQFRSYVQTCHFPGHSCL